MKSTGDVMEAIRGKIVEISRRFQYFSVIKTHGYAVKPDGEGKEEYAVIPTTLMNLPEPGTRKEDLTYDGNLVGDWDKVPYADRIKRPKDGNENDNRLRA